MIKDLFTTLCADENILYFNEGSFNVLFTFNGMVILNVDFDNINLDNDLDEDGPDTIINIELLAWHIKFKKRNALKKELNDKLMPIS